MKKLAVLAAVGIIWGSVLGCASSDVAVNKDDLAKIRTVAVLGFDLAPGINENVAREAEAAMQGAFLKAGFKVLERTKIDQIMNEKDLSMALGDNGSASAMGSLLGADAVLFGKVFQNAKSMVTATDQNTGASYRTELYQFLLQVRLTSTAEGAILLDMKNSWNSYQNDPEFFRMESLEAFRSQVLAGMVDDLVRSLKKK